MSSIKICSNVYFLIGCTLLWALAALSAVSAYAQSAGPPRSARRTLEDVDSLLGRMTLLEKVGQLNMLAGLWDVTGPIPEAGSARRQYESIRDGQVGAMLNVTGAETTRVAQRIAIEESRLGIPLLFGYDVIHGYATMFPIPLAESSSWNLALMRRTARAAAVEATGAGIHWTFAPMVDVSRDARWGRVMEGAGEDPHLGARAAAARVRGFQTNDLSAPNSMAACAKHFAAYGFVESGREYNTVDIGDWTLQNVVMPPFRSSVDADVASVMTAFNEVNGIPATAHRDLLRRELRDRCGFGGLVLSDYGSCQQLVTHGFAANLSEAARKSLEAGCDMDMEGRAYITQLPALVEGGLMSESIVDKAVRRVLKLKLQVGLFDDPYRYCADDRDQFDAAAHLALAREAARESIVLLHNSGKVLPVSESVRSIAVIGPLADDKDAPLGNWRAKAEPNSAVSLLEGVKAAYGDHVHIRHAPGCQLLTGERRGFPLKSAVNETDFTGIEQAATLAAECELVLLVVGEDCFQSGEARSRARIDLPGVQPELVRAVTAANDNTVLLVMSGRPLVLTNQVPHVAAALQVWHLGSQAGHAIADVLTGKYNPSGKLTMSFPRAVGQVPIYYNHKNTGRPSTKNADEVWYSHYEDETNEPLYPFGHGLSYTEFAYRNLRLSKDKFTPEESIKVFVDVRNVGEFAGTETAQLYVRDSVASRTRPVLELKAFDRVQLDPDEQATLEFTLDRAAFGFYDEDGAFVVEPGEFRIFVGGSSESLLEVRCLMEGESATVNGG